MRRDDAAKRELWAKRVTAWKASGLTADGFAAREGINARTLAWWKWKVAPAPKRSESTPTTALTRSSTPAVAGKTALSPLTFVEMTSVVETEPLEVVLPSSVRVRVRPGFDSATLRQLLDVLEARR